MEDSLRDHLLIKETNVPNPIAPSYPSYPSYMCAGVGFFGCLTAGKVIPAFTGVVIEKLNIAYVWHTDYSVPKARNF